MPVYTIEDINTNEEHEVLMSEAERKRYLSKNPHLRHVVGRKLNLIAGVTGRSHKVDDGYKDTLSRIADANTTSHLASQYGNKSIKASQTRRVVEKWRTKRDQDPNK